MRKQRLSVYLEPEIMRTLEAFARRKHRSLSLVAEAAIGSFVTPDEAERQEAAITARLDRLSRQMERLERDQTVAVETLALFVRHWLQATPPPAERHDSAARAKGAERFEAFMEALGRRLTKARGFAAEILEEHEASTQ